jgi:hypothetical protein
MAHRGSRRDRRANPYKADADISVRRVRCSLSQRKVVQFSHNPLTGQHAAVPTISAVWNVRIRAVLDCLARSMQAPGAALARHRSLTVAALIVH